MNKTATATKEMRNGRFTHRMLLVEIIIGLSWGLAWAFLGSIFGFAGVPAAILSAVTLFALLVSPYWSRKREAMWQLERARGRA